MKRGTRRILPIILLLAVIGCMIWYLFVYDRDFTKDMLLMQARSFESRGKHDIAAMLYDLAYDQSGEEDDIAIELAQQYISAGNYTKAEYTLSRAISDNPTAKLYAALCRVYVQQDKLMDAVTILDTIASPLIKEEMDAMRPSVPTATPEADFYTQYITVELSCPDGTVYASTDGQYPSKTEHAYTEGFTLPVGQTMVYTLAVSQDGLVSPLGVYGYTVGGVVEQVTFTDPAMERELRLALGIDDSLPVYTSDLWSVSDFTIPTDAVSYDDLVYLTHLKSLTVANGISQEMTHITALQELNTLHISDSNPSEEFLTAIAALPQLKDLTLRNCGLSTVAPLSGAIGLEYLDLRENTVRNLSPLASMSGLRELYLSNNALTELTALSGLTNLQILEAAHNTVASIEPICHITSLQRLDVSSNRLTGLGSVGMLTGLTHLYAQQNVITDITGLEACTALQELNLANNSLTDITMLSTLSSLTYLNVSNNQITALPALPSDCPLVTVDASHNLLTSVEELRGLSALNNVLLDYNEELEDLTPLDDCFCLILVNAYGTKVTEVQFLTDKSVIVNYNPVLEEE